MLTLLLITNFTGCKKLSIKEADNSSNLDFVKDIMVRIYGKIKAKNFKYEQIANDTNTASPSVYDELTFYSVYSGNSKICNIAVNPNTLNARIKLNTFNARYGQIAFQMDGGIIVSYDQ